MKKVKIIVSKDFKFNKASGMLFGSFIEHMGSVVYSGIFELGHPHQTRTDSGEMYLKIMILRRSIRKKIQTLSYLIIEETHC